LNYIILIPLLPLIGFFILSIFANKISKTIASTLATSLVLGSFILSVIAFLQIQQTNTAIEYPIFEWLNVPGLSIGFDLLIDQLSILFCLVITGVGGLIHLYSVGYMHDDKRHNHFFSYLNLFVFFMLMLVMGANYLMLFIGWEGVGLCSYLLIGFWFNNTDYNNAARKAFIMNRIGDLGLLLGLFLIYVNFSSLDYATVCKSGNALSIGTSTLTAITLLLFVGAIGKSAQIPLFTWLPDAMAGPTPVSALIHAATMVTAGVYLLVRSNVLFSLAPFTQEIVMIVGLATCLLAATIGFKQNDIKKVLAYSTVSQLGLMFFALGLGAYTAGLFHVITHAFFKALLFLGAGSVIHALHHEQDLRNMGGLKDKIKTTYFVFLIGTLAISGFPLLSGFFSKDEILAAAFSHSPIFWILGLLASLMTVGYMFRLLFLAFWGDYRNHHVAANDVHESPKSMTIPLVVLAVLSVVGGCLNLPHSLGGGSWLHHWLAPIINYNLASSHELSHEVEWILMALTTLGVLVVIYFTHQYYVVKKTLPTEETEMKGIETVLSKKYYIDEIYNRIWVQPMGAISKSLHSFDTQILDPTMMAAPKSTVLFGGLFRQLQSGKLEHYLIGMVGGMLLLLLLFFVF
jgi:NADH-quinone oxidoreductase subunit L